MLNRATLIGNLGDNAEVRKTGGGTLVMQLSVATSEKWKDKAGDKHEHTEWHRVVVFGESLINALEDYLRKGQKVFIEGRIQTRKWEDEKTGTTRYSTEIVVSGFGGKILLLGGKDRSSAGPSESDEEEKQPPARTKVRAAASAAKRPKQPPTKQEEDLMDLDDEVPF